MKLCFELIAERMAIRGRLLPAAAAAFFALAHAAQARTFSAGYYKNISVATADGNGKMRIVPPFEAGLWRLSAPEGRPMEIRVSGADDSQPYLRLGYGGAPRGAIVYSPSGEFEFSLPAPSPRRDGMRGDFPAGGVEFRAEIPSYSELVEYRNLALNPCGFRNAGEGGGFYPRAAASGECGAGADFAARNATDGLSGGQGRASRKSRPRGTERGKVLELKIDFGREVEIDRLVVRLRSGFPRGGIWPRGNLEFPDGSKIPLAFAKADGAQAFDFPKRRVSWVKISGPDAPPDWRRAISGAEVWGRDIPPFEAFGEGGRKLPFAEAVVSLRRPRNRTLNRWTWRMLEELYPVESDWLLRDAGFDLSKLPETEGGRAEFFAGLCRKALKLSGGGDFARSAESGLAGNPSAAEAAGLYAEICSRARSEFVSRIGGGRFVYVERFPIAPSFYGYTEGLSDARGECIFAPDSALCLLTLSKGGGVSREVLLSDPGGTIRDPDVSYDGKKILFSWKKGASDDYHIYEMDFASREIRQITSGRCADIEPKYLPTGEIVFNSTRCEQATDCWVTEVSNLYIMRSDGSFMRRVGFDQVCTTYPTVTDEGNVVYTRWDYNDRGQTFPQGLFVMKPDGSFQTELYGNKSWYPTVIGHARQIPGTGRFIATLHGHHTAQRGKLAEIDPSKGRQEDSGVELLAPRRKEKPVRADCYGQYGEQFQYPFPLSEDLFLATFEPTPSSNRSYPSPYGLYLMSPGGRRELLASHPYLDCKQAVALAPRAVPRLEKSRLDYSKNTGTLFIRNIYFGDGVAGVKKGSIKKVRVVKIGYRRAPVGRMESENDEGGVKVVAMNCTPIALGGGAWDTKEILGEVDVAPDGSVYFEIPAQTPVYFQPIDENGCAVTTMRSWTAMQPNEFYSCLGCHGDRDTPNPIALNIAKDRKPEKLRPFYDVRGGFSFRKHIQPILDRHCVSCHNDRSKARIVSADGSKKISVAELAPAKGGKWEDLERKNSQNAVRAFSLLDHPIKNPQAKRFFNDAYYNLLQPRMSWGGPSYADFKNLLLNWPGAQSVPTLLPPYFRGSAKSGIMDMLRSGHGKTRLSREEIDKFAAWIDLYVPYAGDYYEDNAWSEAEMNFYKYYEEKANNSKPRARENGVDAPF